MVLWSKFQNVLHSFTLSLSCIPFPPFPNWIWPISVLAKMIGCFQTWKNLDSWNIQPSATFATWEGTLVSLFWRGCRLICTGATYGYMAAGSRGRVCGRGLWHRLNANPCLWRTASLQLQVCGLWRYTHTKPLSLIHFPLLSGWIWEDKKEKGYKGGKTVTWLERSGRVGGLG